MPDFTPLQAAAEIVLRWSGVLLYALVIGGMSYATLQVLKAPEARGKRQGGDW